MTLLVWLFLAGIAQDVLITIYYRAIGAGAKLIAPAMAALLTLANVYLYGVILLAEDSLPRLLALALGNALGTFLVLAWTEHRKRDEAVEEWEDATVYA